MKFWKIIIFCFLIATTICLIGVFVLQTTSIIGTVDSDMRNLPYGIAVGFNLYLAVGSLPVLLNLNERIKAKPVWSALSFFLLPFVFILFSLLLMWDEPWPGVLFCFPYLSILYFSFIRFRKALATNKV